MFQRAYSWSLSKASHPNAIWYLGWVSFLESFISPIPPDPLLIPMIITRPAKAWKYAFVCTIASVGGGVVGYFIGVAFFDTLGLQILSLYNLQSSFSKLQHFFETYGFWIILAKGLTPLPYKVVTIACGVTKINLWTFLLASLLSRGLRFYCEAYIFWRWGEPVRAVLEKNLTLIILTTTIVLIGAYFIIRYIV